MEDASHSPGSTSVRTKVQPKPLLLIRPISAHDDLTSGFSFSKAKPPQSQTLGNVVHLPEKAHLEKKVQTKPTIFSPAPVKVKEAPNIPHKEQFRPEPEESVNVLNDAFNVPFPTTKAPPQRHKVTLPSQESDEAIGNEESTHEGTDELGKSVSKGPGNICSASCDKGNVVNVQVDVGADDSAPSRFQEKHDKVNTKVSTWTNAEEDAIHILMFNREKLLQHCNTMQINNKAQEDQIARLEDIESSLKAQLKDAHQGLELRDAEIREMQVLKPKLQARVRKFKDYLNGLCDEHLQLKDMGHQIFEIAQDVRNEHRGNMADLDATKNSLLSTQEAIKQERESWIKESANRMKLDEQACLNLREQLQQARIASANENARNERLERNIEQIHSEHEQLKVTLASNHDKLAVNMVKLLEKPSPMPLANPEINTMTPMLHQCVDLLESVRQKAILSPADLQQFQASVEEETKLIMSSIRSCEDQVIESVAVSQQMARQIDKTMAEKALLEKMYISEVAQKELQKELQKEREMRLVFEEQANQSKEESLENSARQKIKEDEIAFLKAALLKKSNEEKLENIARQKRRDDEVVALKAAIVKKCNEESLEHTKIKEHEIAVLTASLAQKSKDENLKNIAIQKGKDEEIGKLRAALVRKSDDESLQTIAKQKAKDDEITKLKAALVKEHDESLQNMTKQKTQEEEIAKLKAALARKTEESIGTRKAKDDEVAMLKAALETARTCSPKSSSRTNLECHDADHPADEDNSQVEEIPRDLTDIMNGTQRGWPHRPSQSWSKISSSKTVTSETVAGLFPLASDKSSEVKMTQKQRTFESSQALTYRQLTKVPDNREVEDSQPQVRVNSQDLDSQMSNTITPLSPPNAPGAPGDGALDDLTARNTATNSLGARPNTKAPRKRTATVADLVGTYESHQPRKKTRSSTRTYGAVIADSQLSTPAASQTIRPLKMTTTNRKSKVSMYQKKFDQYH